MTMVDDALGSLEQEIDELLVSLRGQMSKLRTGRANVAILDGIRVTYWGQIVPLNQCASLGVADARMLTVKPFEKGLLTEIEKAIMNADLGIMPQNDGQIIRLPIPSLNEERRRDLVRQAKSRGEDAKIGLRNHRRDTNEFLKELEKSKDLSQDELKKALERVQEAINRGGGKIDAVLTQKEKEIFEI